MKKLLVLFLFILYIFYIDYIPCFFFKGVNIWFYKLVPLLFCSFILNDLLLSSGIIDIIIFYLGRLYYFLFNINPYGLYVLLVSLFCGTPTNAKIIKELLSLNKIKESDIIPMLSTCIFFNPFFILSVSNYKLLICLWVSNILTAFIFRKYNGGTYSTYSKQDIKFDLNISIRNTINILLNILGIICIFSIITSILPITNSFIKGLVIGLLETTNGIYFIKYTKYNFILLPLFLSFGGLSIYIQIKSILPDTSLFTKSFILRRLSVIIITEFLYMLVYLLS